MKTTVPGSKNSIFYRWQCLSYVIIGTTTIVMLTEFVGLAGPSWTMLQRTSDANLTLSTSVHNKFSSNDKEDSKTKITLVTAYFNLGTVQRQAKDKDRTKTMYLGWASIFKHVENPLVCYTDDEDMFQHMASLREGKENKTKIFLIERNSSWAFQREPRVKEILSQPGYPRVHPYTWTTAYPCVQFAKYDLVVRAAKANYFKTKYIAWVDIGHFKKRESKKDFELVKLDSHNDSCIAMSRVFKVNFNLTTKKIFYKHKICLGGAFSFGTRVKMVQFADQFKRAVDFYLSKNMISTDEQIIYAMLSKQGRKELKPEVDIQYTQARGWFGLGTKMIREIN